MTARVPLTKPPAPEYEAQVAPPPEAPLAVTVKLVTPPGTVYVWYPPVYEKLVVVPLAVILTEPLFPAEDIPVTPAAPPPCVLTTVPVSPPT